MVISIETQCQKIGQLLFDSTMGSNGKTLLYSEVEEGVISGDIFYINSARIVRYLFSNRQLKSEIYSLWRNWKDAPGNREWRTMEYVIEDGKFSIDFKYPDQIDPELDTLDRRPDVILKHFGDMEVDYSKPE